MRKLFAGIVAALVVAVASSAIAEPVRLPKEGLPAFAFSAPAGWRVVYDPHGNLQFYNPDNSALLQLSIMSGEEMVGQSLEALATEILKTAEFPPYTRQQASSIEGRAGQVFYTSTVSEGVTLNLELTLVRLNASTVVTLTRFKRSDVSPAAASALETLVSAVRLIGVTY